MRHTARMNPPWPALLLMLGIALALPHQPALAGEDRPNVVLIVIDDLGYADFGTSPHAPDDVKALGTPAMDRLAASGTLLTEAYATSPICSPSRAGLITGRYQQRWGNYWYSEGGLPNDQTTLAQHLKPLGYDTMKVGKTHLGGGPAQHPLDHGYDRFFGFIHHTWDYIRLSRRDLDAYLDRVNGQRGRLGILCVGPLMRDRKPESVDDPGAFTTELFTDEAIAFIEEDRGDRPYLLHLSYNAMHMPTYVCDPDYAKKLGVEQPPWDRDAKQWEFPFWEPNDIPWQQWHRKWGHLGEIDPQGRKRYLSHLLALDDNLGRLLDAIDKTGEKDNTIVVFVSDNGGTINTYANNGPLNGWKFMFGEGGLRIPMIIAAPGRLPGGRQLAGVTSAMDVVPTVLDLVHAGLPDNLDGKSLVGKIKSASEADAHDMLCWSNGRGARVIRMGDWKLAVGCAWTHSAFVINDEGLAEPAEQDYAYPGGTVLFNLKDDLGETADRAADHPDRVAELKAAYRAWRETMSGPRTGNGKLKKK